MELLVGIALVVVIAFFGMKLMGQVNPDGWETVKVAQVLTGNEGAYALTEEGTVIPIVSAEIAEKIQAGENRLQISKDEATGLRTITGFKSPEGVVSSAPAESSVKDQKKSLTQLHPITLTAETLALGLGMLTLGLALGVFLLVRALRKESKTTPSPKQSDEPAAAESAPAVKAKVTTPTAPPASEPQTAFAAAFQKAETAG